MIKLRGSKNIGLVRNELEQLEEERETIARQTLFQWGDFLKKKYLYRPLIVTIVIQMSQQFSGINAVSLVVEFYQLFYAWFTNPTFIFVQRSFSIRRVFSRAPASKISGQCTAQYC